MSRSTRAGFLVSMALFGLRCGVSEPADLSSPEDTAVSTPDSDAGESAKPPPGLVGPDGAPPFGVDTATPNFSVPIGGANGATIEAPLADSEGRRELNWVGSDGAQFELASAGWVLPPAAAVNPNGATLVCFNILTGVDSELTEGTVPDPSKGVALYCRSLGTDGFGEEIRVGADGKAAWLRSVTPLDTERFRVEYQRDEGWLVVSTSPDDGIFAAEFDGVAFGASVLVRPL